MYFRHAFCQEPQKMSNLRLISVSSFILEDLLSLSSLHILVLQKPDREVSCIFQLDKILAAIYWSFLNSMYIKPGIDYWKNLVKFGEKKKPRQWIKYLIWGPFEPQIRMYTDKQHTVSVMKKLTVAPWSKPTDRRNVTQLLHKPLNNDIDVVILCCDISYLGHF